MKNIDSSSRQSGQALMLALGAVVVLALGALGYFGYQMQKSESDAPSTEPAAGTTAEAGAPASKNIVEPGNPVVAKVGSQEVTRLDVFNFVKALPENIRQTPVDQLYPMALDQVINSKIVDDKVSKASLDGNPEVQKQLEEAKKQIERNVFVQAELDKRITDDKLKAAYEKYKADTPPVEEVKARHILVADEATAKGIIEKIKAGASFEDMAKQNSTDGTAKSGGDLGYFAKDSVVPEFGEAAFAMASGSMSETPVKTQFGYHVIKVEDKRTRPAPTFEQAKAFLEGNLRREELEALLKEWKQGVTIEKFDINGKPLASQDAPLIPVTEGAKQEGTPAADSSAPPAPAPAPAPSSEAAVPPAPAEPAPVPAPAPEATPAPAPAEPVPAPATPAQPAQ